MNDGLKPKPISIPDDAPAERALERQMDARGLSGDERHFLRHLHVVERQLNEAFNEARKGGTPESRISEVYRAMYGSPRRPAPGTR